MLFVLLEKEIVVVTHWVFLTHLLKIEGFPNEQVFQNAEMRKVQLCREI